MTKTQPASDKYILDSNQDPVAEDDLIVWAKWMERANKERIVQKAELGNSIVSTVFLGLDHSFGDDSGIPILYETMVFGGALADEEQRYSTKEQALEGHRQMCNRVRKAEEK